MKLSSYPQYKEAGLPWVGRIPEHWRVLRLKYAASVRFSSVDKHTVEGELPVRLCNYTDVYYNERIGGDLPFMQATATPEEVARFSLSPGDVLVTKDSEEWEDIAVPALVGEKLDGVLCGYHLALVRPNDSTVLSPYLLRSFQARGLNDQFRVAATGVTRFGLPKDALTGGAFLIPPPNEQRGIATFLDRETARIDTLIEKKQRQIELLLEKRASLVTKVVSRGLNPKAELRESGCLGWGRIPAHWMIRPLKHLTPDDRQIMYGIVLPGPDYEGGIPIVKGGNCEPGQLRIEFMSRTSPEIEIGYVRSRLRLGDVVFAIRGSIGAAEIVPAEIEGANLTQDAARISPKLGVCARWLLHAVRSPSFFSMLDSRATGATIRGINIFDLKRGPVAVPPPEEQVLIARYLDTETVRIERTMAIIRDSIGALHELRSSVIAAAVTGQLDVRQEIAR